MFNVGDRVRLDPTTHGRESSDYYGEAVVTEVRNSNAITGFFDKTGTTLCLSVHSWELIDCPGDYEPDLEG